MYNMCVETSKSLFTVATSNILQWWFSLTNFQRLSDSFWINFSMFIYIYMFFFFPRVEEQESCQVLASPRSDDFNMACDWIENAGRPWDRYGDTHGEKGKWWGNSWKIWENDDRPLTDPGILIRRPIFRQAFLLRLEHKHLMVNHSSWRCLLKRFLLPLFWVSNIPESWSL